MIRYLSCPTLFTVWFSVLQVEGVVSDWLLTGSTQEAVHMPRLFEGIYHLLSEHGNKLVSSMDVFVRQSERVRSTFPTNDP